MTRRASSRPNNLPPDALTPAETRASQLLAKGLTVREVAAIMGISHHTVRDHTASIYRRWGISSRAELATEAMARGLIAAPAPDLAKVAQLLERAGHEAGRPITLDVVTRFAGLLVAGVA